MYFCFMILVTGAAGFIGSCLVSRLNQLGFNDLLLVDDFSYESKKNNLIQKKFIKKVDRLDFINNINFFFSDIHLVYHLGARTDTIDTNEDVFLKLNLNYSKKIWQKCVENQIPILYASSAACYGNGKLGFDDCHKLVHRLKPLNAYARSKNNFDKWVLDQSLYPPFWVGVRFFNVYGPNEYHKGRMASVILHAFNNINKKGKIELFKSYLKEYNNGAQSRDFIYVKDLIQVIILMMMKKNKSGIYNLGTGKSRTFNDLARAIFKSMGKVEKIFYIDMPSEIKETYQYYTEANMQKFVNNEYKFNFTNLEEGVSDYINNYLLYSKYY